MKNCRWCKSELCGGRNIGQDRKHSKSLKVICDSFLWVTEINGMSCSCSCSACHCIVPLSLKEIVLWNWEWVFVSQPVKGTNNNWTSSQRDSDVAYFHMARSRLHYKQSRNQTALNGKEKRIIHYRIFDDNTLTACWHTTYGIVKECLRYIQLKLSIKSPAHTWNSLH